MTPWQARRWCRVPFVVWLSSPPIIGDQHVRHRGTIGGSVANNDPAADYPAAVLALNATVVTNKREIKADDFFKGLFATTLGADEIITRIAFPIASKFVYAKFANPASRYALVGVAVAQPPSGARVAVTGRRRCRRLSCRRDGGRARQGLVGAIAGRARRRCGQNDERHSRRRPISRLISSASWPGGRWRPAALRAPPGSPRQRSTFALQANDRLGSNPIR